MRIWVKRLTGVALLIVLQTVLGDALQFRHVMPDFFLIVVLLIAMERESAAGTLWGIILGFIQDVFSGGLTGFNMLTKGLAGYVVGKLRFKMDFVNLTTQVLVTLFVSLLEGAGLYVFAGVFFDTGPLAVSLHRTVIPVALYNSLIVAIVHPLRRLGPEYLYRRGKEPARAA